ncbi:hypothetical protein pEaSNUABM29_00066 [Erwinia phage pEa_SNUABM_29]|nr:hypothetical protein pEaSNUABM29_00066 [Erwinia phage pEa_SNUABM_29]
MMRTVLAVFLAFVAVGNQAMAFSPADIQQFKPTVPTDKPVVFDKDDNPRTVVQKGEFAVVNYGQSDLCPAGGFYLVNTKRMTYQLIDAGTCASSAKVTIEETNRTRRSANTQVLTFWVGKDIAARYPLYNY